MKTELIAAALYERSCEEFRKCNKADDDGILRMLMEISQGVKTDENWFLRMAIEYISREQYDITGFCVNCFVTNREADDLTAPVDSWLIKFYKAGRAKADYREFEIEVEKNRTPPALAWKWIHRKKGRSYPRPVNHLSSAISGW